MAHENFDNQTVAIPDEEDSLECMESPLEKDRSLARRRHLDEDKAKKHSKKALDIVLAKSGKLSPKATTEEQVRAEKKCKNASKKVHTKKHN